MEKKKRSARRWIWLGALVAVIVACVLIYRGDGVGGITDIPGGFSLRVGVLDAAGGVTVYDVRDAAQITALQHYVRDQKSERLRPDAPVRPGYPCLGLSDGDGENARRAAYAGGVWIDNAGRRFAVELDAGALLACIPDAEERTGTLADFPARFLAATASGAWDARLLEPAAPAPEKDDVIVRAHERDGDKLSVTVYNPQEVPVTVHTGVRLEVQLDGEWYAVPAKTETAASASADETAVLQPNATVLFNASVKETEARYGKLPAGRYRIVLLTYGAEFDAE